jgi:hypothetical protein
MKAGDDFAKMVNDRFGRREPFVPMAHFDPDGDCIEFFISDEPFTGKRLDKWVTVYCGRESGQVVGSLIKNIRELHALYPGLDIYVQDGRVKIVHILRAPAYSAKDPIARAMYKDVLTKIEATNDLTTELQLA